MPFKCPFANEELFQCPFANEELFQDFGQNNFVELINGFYLEQIHL